jgi:D-serine deaminase-like pyridoxal phosphate-dependent protein
MRRGPDPCRCTLRVLSGWIDNRSPTQLKGDAVLLTDLMTPAALLDDALLARNIEAMQARAQRLGVRLRPHVKTPKCIAVAERQRAAGAQGITVSTLKEAAEFFDAGFDDILYAVGLAPHKLPVVMGLRQRGCKLKVIVDSVPAAQAAAAAARAAGDALPVLIEIDTDRHRAGLRPEAEELIAVGRALHEGGAQLAGVMTHCGASYEQSSPAGLRAVAEQERSGCVRAAERLRAAGLPCAEVSVGSTPTAWGAERLDGVTELRAGVYVFNDLVMCNIGVATPGQVAMQVLSSVIGHQRDKGWVLVDAGWMALSRDRGTQAQAVDYGYGAVCDAQGRLLPGWTVSAANQEHGTITCAGGAAGDVSESFPIGTRLRILPNHACATAAQFDRYHLMIGDRVHGEWRRFHGW